MKRSIPQHADVFLDHLRNPVGLRVNLRAVATLNEQADFRFGAAIAQQHAARAVERPLGFGDEFLELRELIERLLLAHFQVALRLRKFHEASLEFAERLPRFHHHAQDLQRAHGAVAGGGKIAEDHVPALLAADVEIVLHHRLDHVAVADNRAQDFAAGVFQRLVQAAIGHHRGDERVLREASVFQKIDRGDGHDFVAIHSLPIFIAKDRAIRVAIVRDADLRLRLADDSLDFFGMRRAPILVDVAPIRRVVCDSLGPQRTHGTLSDL